MENALSLNFPINSNEILCLTSVGRSDTMAGHSYGPAVRPYYLIHYILSGAGTFNVNNIDYHLHAGQGFLIEPNYRTLYTADQMTPWSYIWLGFTGTSVETLVKQLGITEDQPIFSNVDSYVLADCVNHILQLKSANQLLSLSYLFRFLSEITQANISRGQNKTATPSNKYVQQAIAYLSQHLATVTVDELATAVNLDRSYLTSLFKHELDLTPSEYLHNFRITKARHLLETTSLNIDQIAEQCGYQRAGSFARSFKQTYGLSPREYRKQKRA